jgi:hypothetical protein
VVLVLALLGGLGVPVGFLLVRRRHSR